MAKKVLGLDIDSSGIKAAEVVRRMRSDVITTLAEQPLPQGTVVDGKVANAEALTKGLVNLLMANDFSASSTVLGVRSAWVTVKSHRFPIMSERELDKALEFEIPELVSFQIQSPRDICFDYFVNSRGEEEVELVLVACPRQNLTPYIRSIKDVGLRLESIDVPAFGWNALFDKEKRRAFIEVSDEQTTIQVTLNDVFKVLRVIPVGADHFRKGVEEAFQCSAKEAVELLKKRNLEHLLVEGTGSKRAIRAAVEQFTGSVVQTLDFVRAQERAANFTVMLDEVVVMGELSELVGLGKTLQSELQLPVHTLRQMDNLQVGFDFIRSGSFSSFGSALAVGLRGLDI